MSSNDQRDTVWDISSSSSGASSLSEPYNIGEDEVVRITACATPTDFTIQRMEIVPAFETHRKDLQIMAALRGPLSKFRVNSQCFAYNDSSQLWCRALIVAVDDDEFCVTVRCLDTGATFSSDDKESFKNINFWTTSRRQFGIRCSLPVEIIQKCETEAAKFFLSITEADLSMQPIVYFDGYTFAELFYDGNNITNALVQRKLAKRLFVVPSRPAYITAFLSSSLFVLQMKSTNEVYNNIVNFANCYSRKELTNPVVGMLVMARDVRDNFWYRATIVSISVSGYSVNFIDHGDDGIATEVGEIDKPEIYNVAPIAIVCKLNQPHPFSSTFVKKVVAPAQICQVKMVKPGRDCG